MSEPPRLFFTGNTLEQAVIAAANYHDVDPDQLAYERIERRYGFLRVRRRVVIKVDPDHPTRKRSTAETLGGPRPSEKEADADDRRETQRDFNLHEEMSTGRARMPVTEQDRRPGEGRRQEGQAQQGAARRGDDEPEPPHRQRVERDLPVAEGEAAAALREGARRLATLAGLELEVAVYEGAEQLEVELAGRDQDAVVEGEGQVLLAFQHLLPRLMYSALGEMVPCRVDSGGFREQRAASLERMAHRAADEVRRSGRPKTLQPMNPADRRTVHLALQDDEDVVTESRGEGFFKRITVRPA